MANSSIILFGKPNSFEAFEITDAGTAKLSDSFIEPELKVSKNHGRIIRYFIRDGYSYLQLYSFALAKGSGREGIVIGASIKSTGLIALSRGNVFLLNDILDTFKTWALRGSEFIHGGLESAIGEISGGLVGLTTEIKYRGDSIGRVHDQTLLLYLPEASRINDVKEEMNQLKEIYFSTVKEVFTASINKQFLYHLQNKFYILDDDNRIIEYVDVPEVPDIDDGQPFGPVLDDHQAKLAKLERKKPQRQEEAGIDPAVRHKDIMLLKAIKTALLIFAAITFFFIGYFFRASKDTERYNGTIEIKPSAYKSPQESAARPLSQVALSKLLADPVELDSLTALCNNISNYIVNPTIKQHKLVARRAIYLHLDTAFFTELPKVKPVAPRPASTPTARAPKPQVKNKVKKITAEKRKANLADSARSEKKTTKPNEPGTPLKP